MKRIGLIALAAIAVVLVAGLFVLDSVLTSKARAAAQELSQKWGRPVEIGSVSTKLLTGLGVRISDVRVGPAEGEGAPLAEIDRIEVKAALLKAATSGGKDVEIHAAEISGLRVNVVRLPDGTTNLERLQARIAESATKTPEAGPKKEGNLSFLRVDHFELSEGRISFLDKSTAGAKELAVSHLDVKCDDLRAGKALDLAVSAAVLADKPNFALQLHTAPLPDTLTPTPEHVTLKIDPIDLSPLAPFVPKSVGLQAGALDANLSATLGALVAGGAGPTDLDGSVHARGLKFAGSEGGKALDVLLDLSVKGDAEKGDVDIGKLQLDLGPAGFNGKGSARGLNTPSPQISGLEIVSHDLDPARLAAYYPPLRKTLGNEVAGPVGIALRASGGKDAQALELRIDLTAARLELPQTLSKAAGAPMTVVAHARGAAASGGPLRFDATVDLAGVDLRPGESVNKAPGQPLSLELAGTRTAGRSSANPEQRIELASLKAQLLDDALDGKGAVELKGAGARKTTTFELALHSKHLDLDKLLLPSKPKKDKKPLDPKTFAGLSGHAAVQLDALRMQKADLKNVVADVRMQEDRVTVEKAQLVAFGGNIDASGTTLALAHPDEPFHAVTKLSGIDLAEAGALFTPKKLVSGKFNGGVDLKGGGEGMKELAKTLAGVLDGHVIDGAFLGKDLVAAVAGPLAKSLPFGLAGKTGDGGQTSLGHDLPFGVTLANGVAKLKAPLQVTRPEASFSLSGGIRLDGTLNLPGTVSLSPQTVSSLTGGKVQPKTAIPVGLRLVGPASSPQVTDLDLKEAVATIVKEAGAGLLGKALGVPGGNLESAAAQKQKEAESQAQAEAQKARQRAQDEAKKVQEDAANKLKGLFGH